MGDCLWPHDDSASPYRGRVRRLPPLVLAGAVLTTHAASAATAPKAEQRTWHGQQIHLYDALRAGWTGKGVVVAVLDGWIDRSHPDFGDRALLGANCTSGTCKPGLGADDHCGSEHGTHVAG